MLDLATITEAELARLSPEDLKVLLWLARWKATARQKQLPPRDDGRGNPWVEWGILAGRGFGKTLTGAQWFAADTYFDPDGLPGQVIAPTLNDVRYVCFEGPVGLLSIVPEHLILDYNKTNLIIQMKTESGKVSTIRGFSAEEPERLRGPQFARSWRDEVAAWTADEATWDMANMGLRLGLAPKLLWTTTPKPKELIRKLVEPKKGRVIVRGSTYDNRANLPDLFFQQLTQYEGTQLGRQELDGELIDAEEGGVIQRGWLRLWPAGKKLPKLEWIVLSMDTAFTEKTTDKKTHDPDPTAAAVFGVFWAEEIIEKQPVMRANVIVLDCWAEHLGFPALIERIKKERKVRYGDDDDRAVIKPLVGSIKPLTSGRPPDILLVEDKGSGISARQALYQQGIEVYPYNPGRADKLSRLHIVSHLFAQKRVWFPESENKRGRFKSWVEPMVSQLCAFRGEGSIKHDDYVDVTTQALRLMMDKNLLNDMMRPKKPGEEDVDALPKRKAGRNPYAA